MWKLLVLTIVLVVPDARDHREDPDRQRPIHEAQNEADRGTGRIVDDATYEVERMQQPRRRTTEEILAEQDRLDRIERQEQKKPTATQRGIPLERKAARPEGGEIDSGDVTGGERVEIVLDVLTMLDEHDRQLRDAQQELANDRVKLIRRQIELQDEFSRQLSSILDRYEIKRLASPTTQRAPAAPRGQGAGPTTRAADRAPATEPIRLPVQTPR